MNSAKNTVLISGGSEGIGFAIAKHLSEGGSRVVMTGRNAERLDEAATKMDMITTMPADVTKEKDDFRLTDQIKNNFPALNVQFNNAGKTFVNRVSAHAGAFAKASAEILTNYLSVVRLTEKLPATAKTNESGYRQHFFDNRFRHPNNLHAYAVRKAALNSYTQALCMRLAKSTSIKEFALMMPPQVVTEFSQAIGESGGFSPRFDAGIFLKAFKKNKYEIRAGRAAEIDIFPWFSSARAWNFPGKNIWN